MLRTVSTLLRGAGLLVAGAAGGTAAWQLGREPLSALLDPLSAGGLRGLDAVAFDDALLALCAAVLLACALWMLATTCVAVTAYVVRDLVPGSGWATALGRASERTCPALLRRLVAGALGVAVTAGLTAAPTLAASPDGPDRLAGLPLPDRPTGSVWVTAAPRTLFPTLAARSLPSRTDPGRPPESVVVRTGESLWSIAAGLLPARATDAAITRAWHRLHSANVSRIGTDPDLILPGTRLVVPDLTAAHHREGAP